MTLEGFAVLCCFMFTVCFTFTTTRLHDSAQLDPRGLQRVEIAGFQSSFTVSRFYLWDRFARPKIDESLKKKAVKLNMAIENQPMSDHLSRDDGDPMQEPVSSCPKID